MKKNLRIVSAAAALLAVAPVAASTVQAATFVGTAKNNTFDAGSLDIKLKAGVPMKWANAESQVKDALAKTFGTDVTLGSISSGEVNDNNQQVVTFTVANAGKTTWPYGAAGKTTNGSNMYWSNNNNGNANKNMIVSTDVAHPSPNDIDKAKPVTFKVTLNYSQEAANKPADNASESINAGSQSIYDADANTNVNITAVAAMRNANNKIVVPGAVNGYITYTDAKGKTYTALLRSTTNQNVTVYDSSNKPVSASSLEAGELYWASFNDVTINLGNDMANTKVKFYLPAKNAFFVNGKEGRQMKEVTTDRNGVADLGTIRAAFYAYDPANMQEVHFYDTLTGNVVTSGSQNLHAVNGRVSVQSLFATLSQKYAASQLVRGQRSLDRVDTLAPQNDFRDQLKKQNIDVDPQGFFKAPASFTINLNAKSKMNGATASLPVTVTVDNAAQTPAAQETTKTVKIMHIATIYDKNGKATHEPALRAYNTVSVVSDPVSLKDEKGNDAGKFYKLAGKDQYIKVGNVDGTSRSLKHNSYVYKSTGKRRGKTVLKKGSSVTTYGKSFMIAGHQMYRIGKNQYVKKANF